MLSYMSILDGNYEKKPGSTIAIYEVFLKIYVPCQFHAEYNNRPSAEDRHMREKCVGGFVSKTIPPKLLASPHKAPPVQKTFCNLSNMK